MGEDPANWAIRIDALRKRYGALLALDAVDLVVARGETFGLVGANGAGKTTLIKCLLELCAYDSGELRIFGLAAKLPRARRRLAYVPERFMPPHHLRAREFIELLARSFELTYDAARAQSMLRELELDADVLERPVRGLSKGMTQKLGLAASFLLERDLYVLDEPMSGLDPAARVAVKAALRRLAAEGRTLFFTSHVLADVEELCSSVAVLERGGVRWHGPPEGLCAKYGAARLEQAFMRCIREK
jgi:ABC-2 type transport system ATP-binding protein